MNEQQMIYITSLFLKIFDTNIMINGPLLSYNNQSGIIIKNQEGININLDTDKFLLNGFIKRNCKSLGFYYPTFKFKYVNKNKSNQMISGFISIAFDINITSAYLRPHISLTINQKDKTEWLDINSNGHTFKFQGKDEEIESKIGYFKSKFDFTDKNKKNLSFFNRLTFDKENNVLLTKNITDTDKNIPLKYSYRVFNAVNSKINDYTLKHLSEIRNLYNPYYEKKMRYIRTLIGEDLFDRLATLGLYNFSDTEYLSIICHKKNEEINKLMNNTKDEYTYKLI